MTTVRGYLSHIVIHRKLVLLCSLYYKRGHQSSNREKCNAKILVLRLWFLTSPLLPQLILKVSTHYTPCVTRRCSGGSAHTAVCCAVKASLWKHLLAGVFLQHQLLRSSRWDLSAEGGRQISGTGWWHSINVAFWLCPGKVIPGNAELNGQGRQRLWKQGP